MKAMLTCQSTEVNKNQNMSRQLIQCEAVKGSVFSYSRFVYFLAILVPPLDKQSSVRWLSESICGFKVTELLGMPKFSQLLSHGFCHLGMAVSQVCDTNAWISVIDEGCQMTGTVHSTCRASRFQVHNLYFHKQFFRYLHSIFWWLVKSKLSKIQWPVPVEKSKYFSPSTVKTQLPSPRSSTSDPPNLSLTVLLFDRLSP